jgi:hypothetical protein
MHGHPQPQGRDPGSKQDSRWQSLQDVSGELNVPLPGNLHQQVRMENRKAQGISLRSVDNAIHFLKSAGFHLKGTLLGKE